MHRFVSADSPPADPSFAAAETAALKRWTRDFLKLGADAVISVLTTPCVDPGCPVVETTVLVQAPGGHREGMAVSAISRGRESRDP